MAFRFMSSIGLCASLAFVACTSSGTPPPDAATADSGLEDAGSGRDADAGAADAGALDAGASDAGRSGAWVARIDMQTGAVLDPGGIRLSPTEVSELRVVSTASSHFVLWAQRGTDGGASVVLRRLSPDGTLLDPRPRLVLDGVEGVRAAAGERDGKALLKTNRSICGVVRKINLPLKSSNIKYHSIGNISPNTNWKDILKIF